MTRPKRPAALARLLTLTMLTAGLASAPARAQDEIELSYSFRPTAEPTKLIGDTSLYVRPNIKLPLYLHAKGPSAVGDQVTVNLYRVLPGKKDPVIFASANAKVTKESQIIKGWKVAGTPPPPPPPPMGTPPPATGTTPPPPLPPAPELELPFQLLVQVVQDGKTVKSHKLTLNIQKPDEYLQVKSQTFNEEKQEISVTMTTKGKELIGPPVEVVLDLDNSPHPLLKRPIPRTSYRLSGELIKEGDELTLRAGKLAFQVPKDNKRLGPIYVNADGIARAFIFETDFKGTGRIYPDKSLRLVVADQIQVGKTLRVRAEANNVQTWENVKLSVWMDMDADGNRDADEVKTYTTARELRLALPPPTDDGAVVLQSMVQDHEPEFVTRDLRGTVKMEAWLEELDSETKAFKQTASTSTSVILDSTPPENIAFVKPLKAYATNKPVVVTVTGEDPESGIREVWFGVGPASTDPKWRKKAVLGVKDPKQALWSAPLELSPDFLGPLEVGVLFVNGAGMAQAESLEAVVVKPGGAVVGGKLGTISVLVMEGERPQNDLDVVLFDEKGAELQRGKTAEVKDAKGKAFKGMIVFKDVPPGKYTVSSAKAASNTQGLTPVPLGAGEEKLVEIKLYRP